MKNAAIVWDELHKESKSVIQAVGLQIIGGSPIAVSVRIVRATALNLFSVWNVNVPPLLSQGVQLVGLTGNCFKIDYK